MTDAEIVAAMERYGGSFCEQLAKLYARADEENRRRIKATWPEFWRRFGNLLALETVVRPRE
jgi:hypothetical protein